MNRAEFEKLDAELLATADAVLTQRRGAYAGDGDVLMNFKQVAQATGLSVAKVWEVYFRKALNAACAVVAGGECAGESREERMVDLLNYVRLGNAIAQEFSVNPVVPEMPRETLEDLMKREQDRGPRWRHVQPLPILSKHARNRYAD